MKSKKVFLYLFVLLMITSLFLNSCDKRVVETPDYIIQGVIATPNTLYPDNDLTTYSEIRATVVDENQLPLADQIVTFKVLADSQGVFLGNVTASSTTGDDGVATAQFHDNGLVGTAEIEASIGGTKKTVIVNIVPIPDPTPVSIVQLIPVPEIIYADDNEATYAEIKAFIENEDGFPVVGDTVSFRLIANGNSIASISATAISNEFGVAKAQLHDKGETGDVQIEATIMNSSATTTVTIEEVPAYHITSMNATPEYIYADNGITYSEISVVVRDEDNFAVTNEYVQFRSTILDNNNTPIPFGNILYNIATDSTGVAQSTFWDDGQVGTAIIEAFVGENSMSINVDVLPKPAVTFLELDLDEDIIVMESMNVTATAMDTLGVVADGTLVVFETDMGEFRDAAGLSLGTLVQIPTENGDADVVFFADDKSGTATITATVPNEISAEEDVEILPGNPASITLSAEPQEIQVNSGETSTITALIEDNYDNVVPGVEVNFSASSGTISPPTLTNEEGIAIATFSPGIHAGLVDVTAETDSLEASIQVTVLSDGVYSLEYAFSGQVDINIQGTGGQESAEIVVNLFDSNGNLIDNLDSLYVNFTFNIAPEGANINNQVYYIPGTPPDTVTVEANNGQAVVSVNSGYEAGTISLKAFMDGATGTPISANKSNIVIHAGPPNSIELTIGDIDSGQEMGGGVWQIECAAIINDEWGNPVDYGSAVWFSLDDTDPLITDPDWATIGAEAYVGNSNASGDSLSGIAYTYLNYEGAHTNDSLYVCVQVSGSNGYYEDSTLVVMPIQFAQIEIVANPIHLDWIEPGDPYDPLWTVVTVVVTDGQNNPINNQEVNFSSIPGNPVQGPNSQIVDFYEITGGDFGPGRIDKWVLFYRYECPPPGMNPYGTTDASIVATVLGTGASADVTVTLFRYADPSE